MSIRCEICGGDFGLGVEVVTYGQARRFHSFACAIQALAPRCEHCQRGIVGRGPASAGSRFCCDRCAADRHHREVVPIGLALLPRTLEATNPPGLQPLGVL